MPYDCRFERGLFGAFGKLAEPAQPLLAILRCQDSFVKRQ